MGVYQNSSVNPFGHIAVGIGGQVPMGLNPTSDLNFLMYATYGGKSGGVAGVVKPQGPKGLKKFVRVPVTGMQARRIQDQLNRARQNAPNYDIFGGGGPACDCAGFAQQMLGDAGINSGPPTDPDAATWQSVSTVIGGVMDEAASPKRWFLLAGCLGVVVAGVLTLLLSHDLIPAAVAIALWPTSILGLVDPTNLKDQIITGVFTFGGNFLLYGVLGLLVRYLGGRLNLFSSSYT